MAVEEIERDIDVKPQISSSGEGLITYARRKRSRSGRSRSPPTVEVFHVASGEGKNTDSGWEHGETVTPGNRGSWKCKWCGLVRYGGGVTRLKKHLAGGGQNLAPCKKVPEHIARAMKDKLLELEKRQLGRQRKKRNVRTTPESLCLDKSVNREPGETDLDVQMSNATQQSEGAARVSKTASKRSRYSKRLSRFAALQTKNNMAKNLKIRRKEQDAIVNNNSGCLDNSFVKYHRWINLYMQVSNGCKNSIGAAKSSRSSSQRTRSSYKRSNVCTRQFQAEIAEQSLKETHDTMLCTNTYDKDELARKDNHWRNILENMLLLPDVLGGSGIGTCITDALVDDSSDMCRMFKLADVTKNAATVEPKDRYRRHCEEQRPDISADTQLDILESKTYIQNSLVTNTLKCQEVFLDILRSENFVLLCDLLGKNFQDMNAENLFGFSQINSKMKNGVYDQSPGSFDQDIQQVWRKFKRIGLEMVLFARNLSNMSRDFFQKVVGLDVVYEDLVPETVHETVEPQCKENQQVGAEQKNSNDLDIATPFPSCESNQSTRPEQAEASCLYKVCTCKQCGSEANGERSLICDECEAVYHLSCAKPAVLEIPTQSWYCALCSKDSMQSPNAPVSNAKQDSVHDNCVVCDRLEFTEIKEHVKENCRAPVASGSRESSVSSMESDDPPEPSRTALSRLCKHCGTCEDEDKRFLICGHSHCPYKFYHIRCLRTSQVASLQQRNKHCWYCPSCLCRACFADKDDDKIVLCDGCDEAYHTYCMKPSRTTIPDGQWYCIQCNMAKAKEGMRRYEELMLQFHGKKNAKHSDETVKVTDVPPTAVDKLKHKRASPSSERKNKIGK